MGPMEIDGDIELRLQREASLWTSAAICGQHILVGAVMGWGLGTIIAWLVVATGMLEPVPLPRVTHSVFSLILGCVIVGALCACCFARRSLKRRRGSSSEHRKSRSAQACRLASVMAVVSLAVLLLCVQSSTTQQLHVFFKVLVGHSLDPLPESYCADAGAPSIDGRNGGGGSGASTQNVRRLASAMTTPWWREYGEDAASAAHALAAKLTAQEQLRLIQGVGWSGWELLQNYYVGSMFAIPRLGIPSIRMQDAGQGFRTIDARNVGRVTAWPCLLGVAATWDAALTRRFAAAVGEEFRVKGANMILGPSVNVHRIARNGRNAEYLSGEDPALGSVLTGAYVEGVQSAGVAATAKHFVLNSQETNRNSESSDASDRTLWEVYYPPFEAAVRAGAAAVMCGYNKVNGTHACGDAHILIDHLREQMGFEGFVMSDWWAVHDEKAAAAGVDQNL